MPDLTDVVVVGGGIMGAALAWELTRRACSVVLLEAHRLANGATGGGFAWINATAKFEDEAYHRLNAEAIAHYSTLTTMLGVPPQEIGLRGGGTLLWAEGADVAGRARLIQRGARLQAWGYPVALLNQAEMQVLEPEAWFAEGSEGLFAPCDRWVDAPRMTRFLIDRARQGRLEVREHCPATGFTRDIYGAISTVDTPQGRISTRQLVLAAGVHTPACVAQLLGIDAQRFPVQQVLGRLVETGPLTAGRARRVLYPPDAGGLHLRPTPAGGLLLAADDTDAAHEEDEKALVTTLLGRTDRVLPGLSPVNATVRFCTRPIPFDGLPLVGPLPGVGNVFVAVTHSGITLAPLLAYLLADEMDNGRVSSLLLPYRAARALTSQT